jgi:hypothetical protein
MVALTAIGMIWTTTAHAAPVEPGPISVHGNSKPTDPGNPTVPGQTGMGVGSGNLTVPGYSGPGVEIRPDIEVSYVQTFRLGNTATYAFRIKNIGRGTAKSVTLHSEALHEASHFETLPLMPLGEMAPGSEKNITVTCTAKPGQTPCLIAWVYAWLGQNEATKYGNDENPQNNWKHSAPHH